VQLGGEVVSFDRTTQKIAVRLLAAALQAVAVGESPSEARQLEQLTTAISAT